jgi:hypothetical protein
VLSKVQQKDKSGVMSNAPIGASVGAARQSLLPRCSSAASVKISSVFG